MNLNAFMAKGISGIGKTLGRFYFGNKRGLAFLTGILPQLADSARSREENARQGLQTPAFLIASVASQCNLRCKGCYARASGGCDEGAANGELSAEEWSRIFREAVGLGVSFILLAGGEPLTRRDVIFAAAMMPEIIFPVFTNGTLLDETYLSLLDEHRNLVPILSLEGNAADTDARRGEGVAEKIALAMKCLADKGILFGVSITVTKANLEAVLEDAFLAGLQNEGCGIAVFVEYVPVEKGTEFLALNPAELEILQRRTQRLKKTFSKMIVLSFPGDEEAMGGCLASGRGFFHINSQGGAEPCPFSPHPVQNLRNHSMQEVLDSDYFRKLREIAACAGSHTGGCTLFACEEAVLGLAEGQL